MSALVAGAVGWAGYELARLRIPRHAALVGAALAAFAWQPPAAAAAAAGGGLLVVQRRLAVRRRAAEAAAGDVPLLAELVLLGLAAGLPPAAAMQRAAAEVDALLAAEVRSALRRARRHGLAATLEAADGHGERLYRLMAGATLTGAPLADGVAAFVEESRHAERSRRAAAARKLPVRLLLPLALLILPGFVLLTIGPALLGALDRLQL
jgi:pilus assembly protein TadC